MRTPNDVKHCPACGAVDVALAADRYGVKTFYCADCEYDWDEQEGKSATPDAPEQPQQ
jgi:transposase-like protein